MLKLLSCLLSFAIIFTSITPSLAQIRGARQIGKVTEGLKRARRVVKPTISKPAKPVTRPGVSSTSEATSRVTQGSIRQSSTVSQRSSVNLGTTSRVSVTNHAVLNRAQVELRQTHINLLPKTSHVPTAIQILDHPNLSERALLLRSDFVIEALDNRVQLPEMNKALDFYRTQLKEVKFDQLSTGADLSAADASVIAGTVADVSSLGLVGTAEKDAALILEIYQKSVGTAAEPAVTASASHALLRLGAYEELAKMSEISTIHPELWEGISTYAELNNLPLTILKKERTVVSMENLQTPLQEIGQIPSLAAGIDATSIAAYMNAGRTLEGAAKEISSPSLPKGFELIEDASRSQEPRYASAGAPVANTSKVQPAMQEVPAQTTKTTAASPATSTTTTPKYVQVETTNALGEKVVTWKLNPEYTQTQVASKTPSKGKFTTWDRLKVDASTALVGLRMFLTSRYGWMGVAPLGAPVTAEAAVHAAPSVEIVEGVRAAQREFISVEELTSGPGASYRTGQVNAGGMAAQRASERTLAAAKKVKASVTKTSTGTTATTAAGATKTRPVTISGRSTSGIAASSLVPLPKSWLNWLAGGFSRTTANNNRGSANQAARTTLSQQYPLISALKNIVMSEADNKYREQAMLRLYDAGALTNIIDTLPQETRQKIQDLTDKNKRDALGSLLLSLYQMGIISSGVDNLVDNVAVQSLLDEVGAIVNTPEFRAEAMARFNQQEKLSAAEGSFEGDVPLPSETDIKAIASTFRDKADFVIPEGEDLGDVVFYAHNVPFYYRNSKGELSPEPVGILSQEKANKLNHLLSLFPKQLLADKPGFYLAKGFVLALDEQGQWKLMVQPGKLSVVESIPSSKKILDEIRKQGSKHVAVDTPYTIDQLLAMAKVLDNNPNRRLQLTLNAPSSFRQFLTWFGAYIGMDSANSLTGPYKKTMGATADLGWPATGITNFIGGFGYVSPWIGALALPLMKKAGYAKSILTLFGIAGATLIGSWAFLGMDGWSVFPSMVDAFKADPSNMSLLFSLMGQLALPLAVMVITGSLFGSLVPIILNIYKDPTARTAANLQFATTKQWSRLVLTGLTALLGIKAIGGDWTIVVPAATLLVLGSALLFFNTPIMKNSQKEKEKAEEDKKEQERKWREAGLDPEEMYRQQKQQQEEETKEFKADYSQNFRHIPAVQSMITRVRGVYWAYAASLMMIGQIANELLGQDYGQAITAAFMLATLAMRTYATKQVSQKKRTDDQLTGMSIPLLAISAALLTVMPYQYAWVGIATALVAAAHYVGTAVPGQLDNTRMQNMVSALIQEEKQAVLNDSNLTKEQQDEALSKLKRKEKDWASRASASYSFANGWGEGGVLIAALLGVLFIDQAPDWAQSVLSAIRDSLGSITSWVTSTDLYGDETNTLTMQRLVFLMSTGVLSFLAVKNWGLTQDFFRSLKTTKVTQANIAEGKVNASTFGISAKNAKQNLSRVSKELDKLKEKMVVFGVISEKKMTDLYNQLTVAYNRLVAIREMEGMTPTVTAEFNKLYELTNTYMTLLTKHKMSTMLEREFNRFINDISVDGLLSEVPENPRYVPENQYTMPQEYEKFEETKMLVREMNNLAGQIRSGQGVQNTTYQLFIEYYNRIRDNLVDYSKLNVADSNRVLMIEQELMKICQELKKADATSSILETNKGPVSAQDVQSLRDMLDGIPDDISTRN